jgi:hypothetical protein
LYDKEILVQEPVLHHPRCFASTSTQHLPNLKTHTNSELDTEKRKFTTAKLDTHSAEKTNTKNDDEDMMFWTGPPKKPCSPILCDKPIFVTEPVLRPPRWSMAGRSQTKINEGIEKFASNLDIPFVKRTEKDKAGFTAENPSTHRKPVQITEEKKCTGAPEKVHKGNVKRTQTRKVQHRPSTKNEDNGGTPLHIPPRDPLLHVPIVTPLAPINQDLEVTTPATAPLYTHVSIKKQCVSLQQRKKEP